MLYIPSKFKYKKQQKGKSFCRVNKSIGYFQLKYGSIGLKALTCGRLTSNEIKTARQVLNKKLKKRISANFLGSNWKQILFQYFLGMKFSISIDSLSISLQNLSKIGMKGVIQTI